METVLTQVGPVVAAAAGTIMLLAVGWTAWRTWTRWKRVVATQDAATALLDVHAARLETATERAVELSAPLAAGSERLTESVSELGADVAHLRWMLRQVPDQRARLRRELVAFVAPHRSGSHDD